MIAAIITRGYGSFGSIAQVMCAGYFVSVSFPSGITARLSLAPTIGIDTLTLEGPA